MHARQNLDERRLARAIFAEQRVHFARPQHQLAVGQRTYASERFARMPEFEPRYAGSLILHSVVSFPAARLTPREILMPELDTVKPFRVASKKRRFLIC